MNSVQLLLNRESSYSGLGLIATCSALIGPLTLEVIYNHADLWFTGPWQNEAYPWIWLSWTSLGITLTSPWSLDRSFHGISQEVHRSYSLHLSMIGVIIYLLFGFPTWVWLYQISLVELSIVIKSLMLSLIILFFSSICAALTELKLGSLISLSLGIFAGLLGTFGAWHWLGFGLS